MKKAILLILSTLLILSASSQTVAYKSKEYYHAKSDSVSRFVENTMLKLTITVKETKLHIQNKNENTLYKFPTVSDGSVRNGMGFLSVLYKIENGTIEFLYNDKHLLMQISVITGEEIITYIIVSKIEFV